MSDTGQGSLVGKTALVTGAGGGIGRACAISLACEGATVIAVDVDEAALKELSELCGAQAVIADLSTPEKFFPDNLKVDILVNNAGIQHVSPIENFPLDKADFMLSLMLRTPFYLIQKSLPYMYEKHWGRVIGISSLHGQVASPYKSIYVMAKHAMEGLHKVLSLEGGPHGVTANTIAPAYVRTALVDKQIDDQARVNNISRDQVIDEIMLAPAAIKRLIEPEEVAAMVLYLCGPNANSMTGSAIPMDNGWMAR